MKKLLVDTGADVWLRQFEKETSVLEKVSRDRNVVQFYGACLKDQASAMLVMEFMAVRSRRLPAWHSSQRGRALGRGVFSVRCVAT